MPRVGCDAKLTQTTGWCPKTRSARMITQQARFTDPLMEPYRKGCFFTIILFYRISLFIKLYVMTNDEIKNK